VSTPPDRLLISGVPGSGKSCFAKWLEREHGFRRFIADDEPALRRLAHPRHWLRAANVIAGRALGKPSVHTILLAASQSASTVKSIIDRAGRCVVIEIGFDPDDKWATQVRTIRAAGLTACWFEGDYSDSKTKDVAAFEPQRQRIEAHRSTIQALFPIRVTTLRDGVHLSCDAIAATISRFGWEEGQRGEGSTAARHP
jgi:hypothetical protein